MRHFVESLKIKKNYLVIIILLFSIVLTACSQDIDMFIYSDETWQVESRLELEPSAMNIVTRIIDKDFIESVLPIEIETLEDVTSVTGLVEFLLDELMSSYREKGIDGGWNKKNARGTKVAYELKLEGQSLSQFEKLLPEDMITLSSQGEDQYHLHMPLGKVNTFSQLAYKQTITLHAGNIISSNDSKQKGKTATWQNPSEVEVVFQPKSQISSLWWWLGGAFFIVLLVVIIRSKSGSKRRCPTCGAKVPRKAEFCTECGDWYS